ncbi:MAG: methyltransferase domain-containing protein [Candidatus Aminicenantales bacterium]
MQRTIEKLAHERGALEETFHRQLEGLASVAVALESLDEQLKASPESASRRGLFSGAALDSGLRGLLGRTIGQTRAMAETCRSLLDTVSALAEARDREWDALGNNHLAMIFKSMEWRVDGLAAAYNDVASLARTFTLLQDQLGRLTAALAEKRNPSPVDVAGILEPLRDWRYERFENRHRGPQEDIRRKQEGYLGFFRPGGAVLDLGCGRGEFLELLRERGFRGRGVDLNAQMIGLCRDKGLEVRQADILEALAAAPDGSLDGIFSSQVIEHISAAHLERLVELAFAKLTPGGSVVLETINPASVFALVQVYFLDLSHRLPVHPLALRFLLESAGFEDVRIVYGNGLEEEKLNALPPADERTAILNDDIDRLNRLLYAAPDYAAAGRKN